MTLKTELKDLSPVKKSLAIEVPVEDVRRESDEVLRLYRKKARLPGFRAGKAPLDLIRKHFGDNVREEVRDRILSRSFREAVRETGLRPVDDPAVEDFAFEGEGPLSYTATFEVIPPIELQGLKDVELTREKPEVADDEVEKALADLRGSRARLVADAEREAALGDVVIADFGGTPREDGAAAFERERMPIEIGGENNLPEFNRRLLGVRAGAEIEFEVDYPADYGSKDLAGKKVAFRVKVHEVKRRELPELDDEFARDLGEFDDLAALRARVREDLEARKEIEERGQTRQAVLDKVLLANPVVLPDALVQREVRHRLEDLVRGMILRGADPEKAEVDWEQVRKSQEAPARKIVHAGLILDAVARLEKIEVEPGAIEERIRIDAQRLGEKPDKLRERLRKQGGIEALRTQLLRERALDYLTSVANIRYPEQRRDV